MSRVYGDVTRHSQTVYPFHPLPTPPHRPTLGIVLIGIGWGLPLFLIGTYLLIFFREWWPIVFGRDSSYSLFWFSSLFILIVSVFVVRPISATLRTRGQELRQIDALELLTVRPDPPVLYLRSFGDDPLVDTTPASMGLIPLAPTYERRFSKVFSRMGPVICIGRPGEQLPQLGAARLYVSNDEWQTTVKYFLSRAAAVVLMAGSTKGLLWEIQTALQEMRPERILFFFPYVYPIERSRRWWYRFTLGTNMFRSNVGGGEVQQLMVNERDSRYNLFHREVHHLLGHPLPDALGEACFLTFSPDGEPQLLETRYPPPVQSLFNPILKSEIDVEWTLYPFLERVTGGRFPLPRSIWLTQHRIPLISMLILGVLLLFGGAGVFFRWGFIGAIPFLSGTFLINVAVQHLMAARRN